MIKLPDRPRVRNDLLLEIVDDEIVIVDKQLEKVHQLNETAAWVWHKLDGTNSIGSITDEFCQAFEVDADVARRDIRELLNQLIQLDLCEQEP